MTLRLVPIPKAARLVVMTFPDMCLGGGLHPPPQALSLGAVGGRADPRHAGQAGAGSAGLCGAVDPAERSPRSAGAEPPALLAVEFAGDEGRAQVQAHAQRAADEARRVLPGGG